jgi:hypothetical protein
MGVGERKVAHLHEQNDDIGLRVHTSPILETVLQHVSFTNPTYGAAMNQAVTFGGTPELIHNGGDSAGWTGAAVAGTWDFADTTDPYSGSAHVSVTTANNNDAATFTDAGEIDMSNYTAITGQVQLVSFNAAQNSINIQFSNNGGLVGNSINLNDYIDTGLIGSYQGFVIPKADLGISSTTVDEMTITIARSGGTRPTIYFDVMQIEETGDPLTYTAEPDAGTKLHVSEIVLGWADVGTGGTAYAYNKIGAISKLSNGIVLNVTIDETVIFSASFQQLADFLLEGGVILNQVDDGTNTYITINIKVDKISPIVLDARENDKITITINDDISGLLEFKAEAIGGSEIL